MRIEKHQKMNNSKWEIREQVNEVKLNKVNILITNATCLQNNNYISNILHTLNRGTNNK